MDLGSCISDAFKEQYTGSRISLDGLKSEKPSGKAFLGVETQRERCERIQQWWALAHKTCTKLQVALTGHIYVLYQLENPTTDLRAQDVAPPAFGLRAWEHMSSVILGLKML